MTINHKHEFINKHHLSQSQFEQLACPYFFTLSMTCIESMPLGEDEHLKALLIPYDAENDEYLTEEVIISSYDSYIGHDNESRDDDDNEPDDNNLLLNGRFVAYEDIYFFGMEKSSAINCIGKDSNLFIIREVHSDYTGLDIFYREANLNEHINTRFLLSSLPIKAFLLRETFLDRYSCEDIGLAIDQFLLKNKTGLMYKVQRNSYCYIILENK